VRLSRLVDPGLVVPTIAQTLGLKEAGSQLLAETLRAHLAEKHLLLVLDNFEQVVGAAPDVAALLESSPGLSVLVTSRTPLHLRGERESALAPLPLPERGQRPPPEALAQYAAVALFLERAQAAKSDFAITTANALTIAEICARLDGLPLAIELAAARVRVLPPEALLARLASGLQLLTGGARDADARQQTMRATIAWSEHLLAPEEQVLFRRLAVFVGGCMLEAAEAICAAPEGVAPLALDLLAGLSTLVEHSLVEPREEGGEPRFGLLQVIREYALERLQASGEAEVLRRAHAEALLALAERAEPELTRPAAGAWFDRLEREYDNLRAALGWAREQGEAESGLRLVAALYRFWWVRGHLREGRVGGGVARAGVGRRPARGIGRGAGTGAPRGRDAGRVAGRCRGGRALVGGGDGAGVGGRGSAHGCPCAERPGHCRPGSGRPGSGWRALCGQPGAHARAGRSARQRRGAQ
jgi:predicted ATPase